MITQYGTYDWCQKLKQTYRIAQRIKVRKHLKPKFRCNLFQLMKVWQSGTWSSYHINHRNFLWHHFRYETLETEKSENKN